MLEVKALSFSYGPRSLLYNLSFSLTAGQVARVRGANGTGKTTLLSILAGLLSPHEGSVSFSTLESLPSIYLASEQNGLYLNIDAYANLFFWARLWRLKHETIPQVLSTWGLGRLPGLAVSYYSSGMKRRLALARVQLAARKVWILDEPTLTLDQGGVAGFRKELQKHLIAGGAAVMVTHEERCCEGLDVIEIEL